MSDCATTRMRFETHDAPLALEAAFDGGRLTSDGGLAWLAGVDRELGLCEEEIARGTCRSGAAGRRSTRWRRS